MFQKEFCGSEAEAKPDVRTEVGPALRCCEREKQQNWVNCGMRGSERSLHILQRSLYTAGSSEMQQYAVVRVAFKSRNHLLAVRDPRQVA